MILSELIAMSSSPIAMPISSTTRLATGSEPRLTPVVRRVAETFGGGGEAGRCPPPLAGPCGGGPCGGGPCGGPWGGGPGRRGGGPLGGGGPCRGGVVTDIPVTSLPLAAAGTTAYGSVMYV